ncbi:unannotated protein [freshwater metagenome]|jgi:hypothetical protein|uniref:Unannotated protein n=1 Tax=freshwater metagenome TaxID=449393 RepID=A0A6J6E4L7_9ZZZZ|nr:hypothetical protein [Actinomycetota bacterium]
MISEPSDELDARQRERLDEIAADLREVLSRLDDVQFDVLREASARRQGRPAVDKTLSQARRSIEKAIHLIGE